MHHKIARLTAILLFFSAPSFAQQQMFQRISVPVSRGGQAFAEPFSGGLNNPQFSEADLNNDGIQDLVIFDKVGDVVLTYLNSGQPGTDSYVLAPEYACNFPAMRDWVLLRDYNHDGAADIFCASLPAGTQEVQVFRGYFQDNMLHFTPYTFGYPASCLPCNPSVIWYPDDIPGMWVNLSISKADYPAVDDVDNDGDLDIVTFEASVGGHVWLVKNMSVEMGYGDDSLKYEVSDKCWGRFYESGLQACINTLSPDPDICSTGLTGGSEDREERHPGSTVLTYDQNGDGDRELVLGDISFDCLNMMTNGGTPTQAWMTAQDTHFPEYDVPAEVPSFPAAFHLDVNNDGKKDLLVAPNSKVSGEDRLCTWWYENIGSNNNHVFALQTKSFLVDRMIDLGSATHPAFADVNGDGLIDLVVGNFGYFLPPAPGTGNGQNNASLYLFLNVGTASEPAFELSDPNWLNLAAKAPQDFDFAPVFADMDNDNDLDMLVGSNLGAAYYYRNEGVPGGPMLLEEDPNPMWISMDVGIASVIAIKDVDQDGLKDLILGERNGNLNWFKNKGSVFEPLFTALPDLEKLGGVDTDPPFSSIGNSAPVTLLTPEGELLLCGTSDGMIEAYSGLTASNTPIPKLSDKWGGVDDGARMHPAFADIDEDGILEMVCGNQRGGLTLYKTQLVDCTVSEKSPLKPSLQLRIMPNPATDWVRVQWPDAWAGGEKQWRLVNALGQILRSGNDAAGALYLSLENLPTGLYFVEVQHGQERTSARVMHQEK
jgi:hypothetical protein